MFVSGKNGTDNVCGLNYRRTFDEKAVQVLERNKIGTEKGRVAKQGYCCFFNKGRACVNVNFRSGPGAG